MSLQILIIETEGRYSTYMRDKTEYDINVQESLKLISMDNSDILIIDSHTLPVQDIIQKIEYLEDYQYVFYVGHIEKEDQVLLKLHSIIPIETTEPTHVLSALENLLNSHKNDRLFGFIGADRKAGNTTLIHSIAENLVQVTKKSILVISLNNNLTEPIYSEVTLDYLKSSIVSQRVTFDEIINVAHFNGKYSFIGASRNILEFSHYTPEEISYLYTVLTEQDSHLVLIDLGSDVHNPFHSVGFDLIHHLFLVTKPSFNYQYGFKKKVEQLFLPYYKKDAKSFYTILNGTENNLESLKEEYKVIAKISQSDYGMEAENSKIPLHKLDKQFATETAIISTYIAKLNGSYIEIEKEKKRFSITRWMGGIKNGI